MTETANTPPMKAGIVPVTPLQQNCSLIWCTSTNKGALIDPGGDLDRLKAAVAKSGVELEKILITHGHIDHCGEAGVLAKELGLPIEGPHEADRFGSAASMKMARAMAFAAKCSSPIAGCKMATR